VNSKREGAAPLARSRVGAEISDAELLLGSRSDPGTIAHSIFEPVSSPARTNGHRWIRVEFEMLSYSRQAGGNAFSSRNFESSIKDAVELEGLMAPTRRSSLNSTRSQSWSFFIAKSHSPCAKAVVMLKIWLM
jgi:hypothetical protein